MRCKAVPSSFLLAAVALCLVRGASAQGLRVSISSSPEAPPFPAATWILLSCDINTTLPVTYDWIIYLCDNTVLTTFQDFNNPGVYTIRVRSTPSICLGDINCTAVDLLGLTGEATWRVGQATGAGLWGTTQPLSNNSALVADTLGAIASIDCHSASTQTNIGQWVSPSGSDITSVANDDFDVVFMNGDFLSYSRLQLVPGASFSSANEGVYSCFIPDENGIQQNVHVGIYSNGYPETIQIPSVRRYSQSPLVIECVTSGLPPTTAVWAKPPTTLSSNATFQIVSILTDAVSTSYSHRLAIHQSVEQARGLYYCLFQNELTGPVQNSAGPSLSGVIHFFSLYLPGDVEALICTISGADVILWRNGDTNALVSPSNRIEIRVNDSIHHTEYICYGYSGSTLVGLVQFTVIVNVPGTALEVSATETNSAVVGNPYGVVCLGAKAIGGLISDPVPVWLDSSGTAVLGGGGGVSVVTTSAGELTLSFSPLQTSHAGQYTCQVSLMSPALSSPIVETAPFTVTLQIPPPVVAVTAADAGPFYAGGSFTLSCVVTISSHVDTSVGVSIAWQSTRMLQNPLTTGGRVAVSGVISTESLVYRSTLTLSELSVSADSGAVYSCTATVSSAPPSPYISASPSATAAITIAVLAPVLTVSLDPPSVVALDVPPFNSFTLCCNGSAAVDNTAATMLVEWSKQMAGNAVRTVLASNGASVNISTTTIPGSIISELATVETSAGRYTYTCTVSVQEPGDDPVVENANATVTIRGPALPGVPSNAQATVTTFTTAVVEWDVPSIAYTPEDYLVQYGTAPQSLNQFVQVSGSASFSTLDEHYIVPLLGLQVNTFYFYQITASNQAGSTSTAVLSFMVEDIPLITAIAASGPPTAGEALTLTCTVTEEEDITGIPAVTWLDPAGQTITSGGDLTVVHQLAGLTTTLTLQFSPLRSSHSGLYTCRAELNEIPYVETANHTLSVNVANLPVSIQGSSTSYTAATPLTVTCLPGVGAVGAVQYQWSSTCTGECFVAAQTTPQLSRSALRSVDSGLHTCTLVDEVGNFGNATLQVVVQGVGFYLTGTGIVNNNTVVLAAPGGTIESLQCISGSTVPNVGQWIAPNGQDITRSNTDPFDTTVGGSANPGHLAISLAAGRTITSSWEGVYTCSIPDETGVQQLLYIGIYATVISPSVVSLVPLSNPPSFTLVCSSTGSAASGVVWWKDGTVLFEGAGTYNMTQNLINGVASTYDNMLVVSNIVDPNSLPGNYSCMIGNAFGSSEISKEFAGIKILRDQDVFIVGQSETITCTSDLGVSTVEWLGNNGPVFSVFGSSSVIHFDPVNDHDHNTNYTCTTVADFGSQERDIIILAEVNPEDILVNITASPTPAFIGQDLSVVCTVQTPPNLYNIPTILWQYPSGARIVNTADVTILTEILLTNGGSRSTVTFRPLSVMHGMEVVCLVEMPFNAPPYHFSEAAEFDLIVSSPALPSIPVDVAATEVTSISAVVQWRVPLVSYTPEHYVVEYSTNRDILSSESPSVEGRQNVALTNQSFSVSLTELFPDTVYFFRVVAINEIGPTNGDILSFMTLALDLVIPRAPVNVNIVEFMSTSAFVEWTVPTVASSREQYVAMYGTDRNALIKISDLVQGLEDTSIDDQTYGIRLTSLIPSTTYFVRILAINNVGSTSSEIISFTTRDGDYLCSIHFQLLLGEVSDCSRWREIDSQQKLGEIQSSLFETFQGKCSCSISEDEIQNARFLCFEDPKYVVFRASLVANFITSLDCDEIVSTLLVENRKDTILVQDDQLSVDPSCVALLDSLDDEFDCKPTAVSPSRLTGSQSSTIIGVVVGGCVFLLLLLTVVVFAIVMFIRHRKRNIGETSVTYEQQSDILAFENPCYLDNKARGTAASPDPIKQDLSLQPPPVQKEEASFSVSKVNPVAGGGTPYSINAEGEYAEILVGGFGHDEKQPLEKDF